MDFFSKQKQHCICKRNLRENFKKKNVTNETVVYHTTYLDKSSSMNFLDLNYAGSEKI